jgi:hypothetical protein
MEDQKAIAKDVLKTTQHLTFIGILKSVPFIKRDGGQSRFEMF